VVANDERLKSVTTQICVIPDGYRQPWVCSEVMRGNEVLYTLRLFPLYDHEKRLNLGRFVNYVQDSLELQASVRLDIRKPLPVYACMEFATFNAVVQKQAEWCADMCEENGGKWSLTIEPHSVHDVSIHFSFDNPTIAVAFKLLWS
jgi:hypothetical protein